jgi:TetR/AcrR family transcriptional regulator
MKDAAKSGGAGLGKSRPEPAAKRSRIQTRNRKLILDAALEVFSAIGFRGATLDQIAAQAGLSKPNILYYFDGKEAIHVTLLNQLMETWLDPLEQMNPDGRAVGGDPGLYPAQAGYGAGLSAREPAVCQ